MTNKTMIRVAGVGKTFIMHLQGGARLPALQGATLQVAAGECVVLAGPSGSGKSTLLKMIYGNYRCDEGSIRILEGEDWVDVARAAARDMLRLRQNTISYVSQFLRVIPRVSAFDIVVSSARMQGVDEASAKAASAQMLERLNVPARLWSLPPATFSGGEQQRVNIARGFVARHPIVLLDEPTASLDDFNRACVAELITEKKRNGAAILGIFHDADIRARVADRLIDVAQFIAA